MQHLLYYLTKAHAIFALLSTFLLKITYKMKKYQCKSYIKFVCFVNVFVLKFKKLLLDNIMILDNITNHMLLTRR